MIIIEEKKQRLKDAALSITTMAEEIGKVAKNRDEADKLNHAIIELKSKGFKVMFPVSGWRSF
jgi:hypothetical protein